MPVSRSKVPRKLVSLPSLTPLGKYAPNSKSDTKRFEKISLIGKFIDHHFSSKGLSIAINLKNVKGHDAGQHNFPVVLSLDDFVPGILQKLNSYLSENDNCLIMFVLLDVRRGESSKTRNPWTGYSKYRTTVLVKNLNSNDLTEYVGSKVSEEYETDQVETEFDEIEELLNRDTKDLKEHSDTPESHKSDSAETTNLPEKALESAKDHNEDDSNASENSSPNSANSNILTSEFAIASDLDLGGPKGVQKEEHTMLVEVLKVERGSDNEVVRIYVTDFSKHKQLVPKISSHSVKNYGLPFSNAAWRVSMKQLDMDETFSKTLQPGIFAVIQNLAFEIASNKKTSSARISSSEDIIMDWTDDIADRFASQYDDFLKRRETYLRKQFTALGGLSSYSDVSDIVTVVREGQTVRLVDFEGTIKLKERYTVKKEHVENEPTDSAENAEQKLQDEKEDDQIEVNIKQEPISQATNLENVTEGSSSNENKSHEENKPENETPPERPLKRTREITTELEDNIISKKHKKHRYDDVSKGTLAKQDEHVKKEDDSIRLAKLSKYRRETNDLLTFGTPDQLNTGNAPIKNFESIAEKSSDELVFIQGKLTKFLPEHKFSNKWFVHMDREYKFQFQVVLEDLNTEELVVSLSSRDAEAFLGLLASTAKNNLHGLKVKARNLIGKNIALYVSPYSVIENDSDKPEYYGVIVE